jgi:hypothetical protein
MFAFTLLFLLILNHLIVRVLRSQMDETALVITTNLSDAAATYLSSKDLLQLDTTVTKYARLSRVAYVAHLIHRLEGFRTARFAWLCCVFTHSCGPI